MRIYANELDIRDQLENNRISFASQLQKSSVEFSQDGFDAFAKRISLPKAVATNLDQPDLYYMDSVLVSVGINKNDDYFDAEEVWQARKSPEDKQINFDHNEKDIIGHMTACYAVDEKYTKIPDDVPADRLPKKFHIIASGVLYKKWEDEDLKKRMGTILDKIDAGEIYVSMECLFSDFDYILIDGKGTASIVDRDSSTSFLTKYLRAYGGKGVYNDQRIGRVIRNITFSGEGMVEKPANPESIIFNSTSPVVIKAKEEINGEKTEMSKETEVTVDTKSNAELQAVAGELSEVKQLLAAEKQARADEKARIEREAKTKAEKDMNDLKDSVKAKDAEIESLKAKVTDAEKAVADAVKKVEAAEKDAKAAQEELAKIALEKKTADRVAAIAKKTGKSEKDAAELEKEFASVDDKAFAAIVANLVAVATPDEDDDDDEDSTVASVEDLENVEKTKTQAGAKGKNDKNTLDECFTSMAGLWSKHSRVQKPAKSKSNE
jgi:hypothetical protein